MVSQPRAETLILSDVLPSASLYFCPSICLPICLCIHRSAYLSACFFVRPAVSSSDLPSMSQTIRSVISQSDCPFVR